MRNVNWGNYLQGVGLIWTEITVMIVTEILLVTINNKNVLAREEQLLKIHMLDVPRKKRLCYSLYALQSVTAIWVQSKTTHFTFPECRFSHNLHHCFQSHWFSNHFNDLIPTKHMPFHLFPWFYTLFWLISFLFSHWLLWGLLAILQASFLASNIFLFST